MLHFYGDITAMELGYLAKEYIPLYLVKGETICYVAFNDLKQKKKRFVKFECLAGQWVYVDLCDSNSH